MSKDLKRRVVITGGRGNLGKTLVRLGDFEAVPIGRSDWDGLPAIMRDGVDVVNHTACDIRSRVEQDPERIVDSDLVTTGRILNLMREHDVPRMIFLSSCAVYGSSSDTRETSPCQPISINGLSKYLNERIIERFCASAKIRFEHLRVFNMYGGDDQFSVLHYLKRALENGQPFVLNNGGLSQRDFVHVEDVAKLIIKLLDVEHDYTVLNIGSGRATRIRELVEWAREICGDFPVRESQLYESEYSRANIDRLETLVDHEFVELKDALGTWLRS